MKSIYEFIDLIRQRPEMYVGDRKLSTLYHVLSGFEFALNSNTMNETKPDFKIFHVWIRERLNVRLESVHYLTTLLRYNKRNEKKAFEHFFELIDEYRKSDN